MNILITGASGFVGHALCQFLQARQQNFTPILRSLSASPWPQARVMAEICPESAWQPLLGGVDTVVHLAARVHVMQDAAQDPLAAYRQSNCAASLHLARQAAQAGVRRMVFISSIKVNGESTAPGLPFRAEMPAQPQDPYGVSKWEAEQGLWQIAEETGLEVVVIRPPLVYGPGVKANFAQLMRWVAKGIPLPLAGMNNLRSMVYLENLLDLIWQACIQPQAVGQTFLVSDGQDVSSAELVRALAQAMGRPARLFSMPTPILEFAASIAGRRPALERLRDSLQVEISETCTRLQWQPPYTLQQGLLATVQNIASS